jgi:hypothetical protein
LHLFVDVDGRWKIGAAGLICALGHRRLIEQVVSIEGPIV